MTLFLVGLVVGVVLAVVAVGSGAMARAAFYVGRYSGIRESGRVIVAMRGELVAIQNRLGYKCGAVRGEG